MLTMGSIMVVMVGYMVLMIGAAITTLSQVPELSDLAKNVERSSVSKEEVSPPSAGETVNGKGKVEKMKKPGPSSAPFRPLSSFLLPWGFSRKKA
jgi:hypothetical protein